MKTQQLPILIDFSMVSDTYSLFVDLEQINNYSVQCYWTGAPSGKIYIQVSNDEGYVGSNNPFTPTHWTTIPLSYVDITASVENSLVYKDALAGYRWIRVGYEYISGSGNLTINCSLKGLSP